MRLIFIRHADPDYAIDSLTRQGWKEAEYLAAVTGDAGLNTFETNPYLLHRINIPRPHFGIEEFRLRIWKAKIFARLGLFQNKG